MTSNFVIALLTALGGGAWIYAKMFRSSGGNNKGAIMVAGIGALIIFLAVITLLGIFFK